MLFFPSVTVSPLLPPLLRSVQRKSPPTRAVARSVRPSAAETKKLGNMAVGLSSSSSFDLMNEMKSHKFEMTGAAAGGRVGGRVDAVSLCFYVVYCDRENEKGKW